MTPVSGVFYNEILASYRIVKKRKFDQGRVNFQFRCEETMNKG